MNERERVSDYIQSIKETIANPVSAPGWVLVTRQENTRCILELGFTSRNIQDILLDLSVTDYIDGPCQDRDQKGDLWMFGKVTDNRTIYIKIKLASFGQLKRVRVISFHFAEYPVEYPFR